MSRYMPPAYKKARKEVNKKKTEKTNFYKYQIMQHILDKHWNKRNKQQPELMLSGIDEQMIFDCMEDYLDLKIQDYKKLDTMKETYIEQIELKLKDIKENSEYQQKIINKQLKQIIELENDKKELSDTISKFIKHNRKYI